LADRGDLGEVKVGGIKMKYAIIEDGGKQYKAVEGDTIEVDHYKSEVGEQIELDRVLLVADDGEVAIGAPYLTGTKVEATVVEHFKAPKIMVFKYKPKIRYRVKTGHRQLYTRLRVDSILKESGGNNGS
jgi:large subunit ribosomal protein L21